MVTSHTPNDTPETQKKKEDEAFWERMQELQKQLDEYNKHISDLIDDCNKMAERCLERMREIKRQIANNNEQLAEYEKKHKNIAEEGRKFERTGSFERGADGKLANKDAQKALDDYMRRTGEHPKNDSEIYEALLRQMQFEKDNEMRRLREKNEELDVEHETLRVQRDEILERAKELTAERNRINNDPSLSPEEKIAKIKEMWERERENNEVLMKAWEINEQPIRDEIDNTRSNSTQETKEDEYKIFESLNGKTKLTENFNQKNTQMNSQELTAQSDSPNKPNENIPQIK